jgi:hypothetical protein
MDALDIFFKKFSYKFPKGYPDMNDEQDVLLLESILKKFIPEFSFSLLKETLLLEVTDREINVNTKKAVEYVLSKADSELGFKAQSDKNRLGNPNKVEPEKMTQLFKDLLGAENITTYRPKQGPNPSGKFTMYEMDTDQFGLVRIIVSGGGNAGEQYEREFETKAKANAGKPNNELPNDLQTLYKALGIDNTKLTSNDIKFEGAKDTKRSLDLNGPQDIGETISDITINYGGEKYYVSLKNVAGSGVYSGPNVPFIYEKDGKVIYDESKKNSNPSIALLFDIFNIDSQKLADGLNEYVTKEGTENSWSKAEIDTEKFKKLLSSSLGFGYYYVRETKPGEVKVIPLLTAEDATNAIGNITKTEIKYPGPNTKQLTIKIDTNSPIFGPSQYQVSIRNTSGKLLPLSLRVSKTK